MRRLLTAARRMTAACLLAIAAIGYPADLAAQAEAAEPAFETIRDLAYVERASGSLEADVYRPVGDGPFPAVLCIHGGAWATGSKGQLAFVAQRLAKEGHVAVLINYRLAPKHRFPAQIEDCRAALKWMTEHAEEYKIDPKRLAAWGYSAGGHLAVLLGVSDTGLKAVVAGGAPCDFRRTPEDSRRLAYWLGGTRGRLPEAYKTASPAQFVSADDPPVFFYHGQDDTLVKLAQPKAMADLLTTSGVTAAVHVVPKAGHIRAFLDRQALAEGVKFLKKHL